MRLKTQLSMENMIHPPHSFSFSSTTLCEFWVSQLFLSIVPSPASFCFQLVTHLLQIIPHIVFPSYSWPSLQSCCIRFPFVYDLSHSFISHSFYMPQPAQLFTGKLQQRNIQPVFERVLILMCLTLDLFRKSVHVMFLMCCL